jgi:hypothetical protein
VPPYRMEGNVSEPMTRVVSEELLDAYEAEIQRLTVALQEEQAESLRQAEIARDALAQVERLTALLAVERGQREDTEATLEAIKVILPHRVEHNGEIPNEVERLTAREKELEAVVIRNVGALVAVLGAMSPNDPAVAPLQQAFAKDAALAAGEETT